MQPGPSMSFALQRFIMRIPLCPSPGRSPQAKGICLAAVFALLCAGAGDAASATAQTPLSMQTEDQQTITWNLTADSVIAQNDTEVLEARGNVILRRGSEYMQADFARYYITTNWVFLRGNIVARMGKDTLYAGEAEFDLRSRIGWLKQGKIYMEGPHIYMAGERINKHWGDVYTFKNATITACDGPVPAWSLQAEEAVVEMDGYAQLWRSKFQVKDIPVTYLPWMMLPAKRERQSGFLPPETGFSSRLGVTYNQPFFWALDSSRDVKFNEYFMSDRGLMQGIQYRSRPSAAEAAWLRADWLYDAQRVTSPADNKIYPDSGLVRKNPERYWLRGMYDGELPGDPKWKLRGDLDFVSDQNYLKEFKRGFSGFYATQQELRATFNRDLRERDMTRVSSFMLFRDWERFSAALSARYTQNPALANGNAPLSTDTTVQQLPMANLYLHQGALVPGFPLEVAASAEAAYMYRRSGTQGARYVTIPTLTLPLHSRYGSMTASAGIHQSIYASTREAKEGEGPNRQYGDTQTVPEFRVNASTEFMRVFPLDRAPLAPSANNIGETRWQAIRHTIQPRIGYANSPNVDQDKNPLYDSGDRLRPLNELTYSITNILTRKRQRVVMAPPEKPGEAATPKVNTEYLDILRSKIEHGYDLREATRTDERTAYPRRPHTDIMAENIVSVDEYLSFTSRIFWSPYMHKITRNDLAVTLRAPSYGALSAGLDYRDKIDEYTRHRSRAINTLALTLKTEMFGPWQFRFRYRYDYERGREVEQTYDIAYKHQCFEVIARSSYDTREYSFQMLFVLTGLGG